MPERRDASMISAINNHKNYRKKNILRYLRHHYELYLFLLPCITFYIIFRYVPIYGAQIAFKDYRVLRGIWGSSWIGLDNFRRFFNSPEFFRVIRNTLAISLYQLSIGFPSPIIFALILNQVVIKRLKRAIQTVTYMPYFISTVVLVSMLFTMLAPKTGVINHLLAAIGQNRVFFMGEAALFPSIFAWSGIWQFTGWNSIIYLAALSGINPELYESAVVDGANKFQKIIYIDIPGLLPTIAIMFIISCGQVMTVGYEKAYLMQNMLNLEWSEVISTFVYKRGLLQGEFGYATAAGLFEAFINFSMVVFVNYVSNRLTKSSLW